MALMTDWTSAATALTLIGSTVRLMANSRTSVPVAVDVSSEII
jgi:hypothetical protein